MLIVKTSLFNVAFIVEVKSHVCSWPCAAACVTLMVCVVTPIPLTVIVAVRGVVAILAVVVTVTVPLLLPEVEVTVAQVASLLTVQSVLDVILNDFCSPAEVTFSEFVETDSMGAGVAAA